jgi:hypothetical protein
MKTSTHRMIQLSALADTTYARACAARRCATIAAQHNMRGAAIQFSRDVWRAHGVYLAAMGRIARATSGLSVSA